MSHLLRKTDVSVKSFYCAGASCIVKSHSHSVIKQRHSEKVFSCFHPELESSSSSLWFFIIIIIVIIIISGSHDWGVEEGATEEALYTEVDPEVEAAGSQLVTAVRRPGSCWSGAGLCLEAAWSTWEGWWRTGEGWSGEGGELKLARGANWRGCRRLTDGGGNCGATCRRAWRGGCRWDSEERGRICFGWSLCTCPLIQKASTLRNSSPKTVNAVFMYSVQSVIVI